MAETCSIPDEYTYPDDEGPDARYSPDEDTITIIGADAEDYPERSDDVFDKMICYWAFPVFPIGSSVRSRLHALSTACSSRSGTDWRRSGTTTLTLG